LNPAAQRLVDLYAGWQLCPAAQQAERKTEFDLAVSEFAARQSGVRREAVEALVRRLWHAQKQTEEKRRGLDPGSGLR
jgi:hypothetical protein